MNLRSSAVKYLIWHQRESAFIGGYDSAPLNSRLTTLIAVACAAVSMLHAGRNLSFSPDSTNYVAAARNLVSRGELVTYANWPSRSMEPEPEPYTEQPPGLPLCLIPFLAICGDPIQAAMVVQLLAIVALFGVLLALLLELRLNFYVSMAAMLIMTTMICFRHVYMYFWTETPFIAVSLGVLLAAIKWQKVGTIRWLMVACFLLAVGSMLKFIGIFNLAFTGGAILAVKNRKQRLGVATGLVLSASLPVLIWFLRNKLLYGGATLSHEVAALFRVSNIPEPYWYFRSLLLSASVLIGSGFVRVVFGVLALGAVVLVGGYPLILLVREWTRMREGENGTTDEHGSRGRWDKWTRMNGDAYLWAGAGLLVHFIGIYGLSLVCGINQLEHRLLSPSIAIGVIVWALGLQMLTNRLGRGRRGVVVGALFALFLVNGSFAKNVFDVCPGERGMRERALWKELTAMPEAQELSHFYSDRTFAHQLFADIPQRIIWDEGEFGFEMAEDLKRRGRNPFFLFRENSKLNARMEKINSDLGLERVEMAEGYVMYRCGVER